MRQRLAIFVTLVVAGACAQASPERTAVNAAAAALGGADRIEALKALRIEGSGIAPLAGQNRMPGDELPVWKVSEYMRAIELVNERTRVSQVREAQFLFAGDLVQRQTQGLDGDIAYNVAADGSMARAGDAAARERRIELLHHPITIVRAALDTSTKLTNARTDGNDDLVDVTTAHGDVLTLGVDRSTHLPSRVISMGDNANLGDVATVTTFSDYEEVGGVKLPRRLTTRMDRFVQLDLHVAHNSLNDDLSYLATPDSVRLTPAPEQPPVVVTAQVVAPGIWWLAGSGNHRSVVFEFADHLVLFEVPLNEARSKAVIDKARTLSSKPLTTAIVSHHHFDHSGGLRVAVAEGLTIVTRQRGVLQGSARPEAHDRAG